MNSAARCHHEQWEEPACVEIPDQADQRQDTCRRSVQKVATGQLGCRTESTLPRQLAVSDHRAREGHGPDEDSQGTSSTRRIEISTLSFLANRAAKPSVAFLAASSIAMTLPSSKCALIAHKDRRQTDERVHRRHQFGHLCHLHAGCELIANGTRPRLRSAPDESKPQPGTRPDERCSHGQCHADNTVPDGSFCAFLTRQTAEAQDEENSCDYVSRCCKSEIHGSLLPYDFWNMASMRRVTRKPPNMLIPHMNTDSAAS